MDLWNPHAVLGLAAVLATAFLLGIVHGITPDEHTWPITFSYAIGGYSTRRGLVAGLTFSLAFTVQRALASELAYLALDRWFTAGPLDYAVYVVVGVVMVAAGWHIMRGRHWHLFGSHALAGGADADGIRDPRPWMPLVHGFIAGWGFGAFAVIIYTVLAPQMPSAWLAWLPGAFFGLGTMAMQAGAGACFGWIAGRLHLTAAAIRQVALTTAGKTLTWGGLLFVAGGAFGLVWPGLAGWSVTTGLHVHNLHHIGLAFVLVMASVLGVGVSALVRGTAAAARQGRSAQAGGTI